MLPRPHSNPGDPMSTKTSSHSPSQTPHQGTESASEPPRGGAGGSTGTGPGGDRGDVDIQIEGLDAELLAQLPTFESLFKVFGFKKVHGRIWGLLVLSGQPLSSRDISGQLHLSQGATSTALNELSQWGATTSEFDSARRCNLHSAVQNTLAIVAQVLRRREQVVLQQFRITAGRTLEHVTTRYGERDPRVLTLRSIISTCEIAETLMNLVVGAVAHALEDSQSLLHKAVKTALRVGIANPGKGNSPSSLAEFAAYGDEPGLLVNHGDDDTQEDSRG